MHQHSIKCGLACSRYAAVTGAGHSRTQGAAHAALFGNVGQRRIRHTLTFSVLPFRSTVTPLGIGTGFMPIRDSLQTTFKLVLLFGCTRCAVNACGLRRPCILAAILVSRTNRSAARRLSSEKEISRLTSMRVPSQCEVPSPKVLFSGHEVL